MNTRSQLHHILLSILIIFTIQIQCHANIASTHAQSEISYSLNEYKQAVYKTVLDKKIQVQLLVDTGSPVNMIAASLVKSLGLVPRPATATNGTPLELEGSPATAVNVRSTQIGRFNLTEQLFLIMSDKRLHELCGKDVDGVIRLNTLQTFNIIFNFSKNSLLFIYPAGLSSEDINELSFRRSEKISIYQSPSNLLYFTKVSLFNATDCIEHDMILDSGSYYTILPKEDANKLHLQNKISTLKVKPAGGKQTLGMDKVTSIRLGNYECLEHHIMFNMENESQNAIVGFSEDLFGGHRVLIDFKNNAMYVVSEAPITIKQMPDSK